MKYTYALFPVLLSLSNNSLATCPKLLESSAVQSLIQIESLRHQAELLNLYETLYKTLAEIREKRCEETKANGLPYGSEFSAFTACSAAKHFFLMLDKAHTDFMTTQYAHYEGIQVIQRRMRAEFKLFERETLKILKELKELNAKDPNTLEEFERLSEQMTDLLKKYAQPKEVVEHHTTDGQN